MYRMKNRIFKLFLFPVIFLLQAISLDGAAMAGDFDDLDVISFRVSGFSPAVCYSKETGYYPCSEMRVVAMFRMSSGALASVSKSYKVGAEFIETVQSSFGIHREKFFQIFGEAIGSKESSREWLTDLQTSLLIVNNECAKLEFRNNLQVKSACESFGVLIADLGVGREIVNHLVVQKQFQESATLFSYLDASQKMVHAFAEGVFKGRISILNGLVVAGTVAAFPMLSAPMAVATIGAITLALYHYKSTEEKLQRWAWERWEDWVNSDALGRSEILGEVTAEVGALFVPAYQVNNFASSYLGSAIRRKLLGEIGCLIEQDVGKFQERCRI